MKQETLQSLKDRRSIRAYQAEQIKEDELQESKAKFDEGAKSAQKDGEAGASKSQFVGAFAVVIANNSNNLTFGIAVLLVGNSHTQCGRNRV